MEKLYVYADFDWLDFPVEIGELGYERLRGSDSYSFCYNNGWLRNYGNIYLCADIQNFPGPQFAQLNRDIFGCFSDCLPDRWGRTLLNRREQIQALEEKRPVRKLSSYDYLIGIDDFSRMGGFRFKSDRNGDYICMEPDLRIPPIADIRELMFACQELEKSEEYNSLPEKKWVRQLVKPGTSLGGARPKAVVMGDDKCLYVAKFPSRKDDCDMALCEHICHLLAMKAGINCADTHVFQSGKYHTLLSRRFDRTPYGRRIHFASAMSLLGLTDGCNADTGNGYLDIVDFILQNCCDVETNLQELYRRVAFNIAVRNSDDHFRNHGFLLTLNGWTLSPAYDMNPTDSDYQSLLINSTTSKADLSLLLDSAQEYMISDDVAENIIKEVSDAVSNWRSVAVSAGAGRTELDKFASVQVLG